MASSCPTCGAPVVHAELHDGPERVMLDSHEAASGPGRYAVWDDGRARPVAAAAEVLAHPLHQCKMPRR